MCLAQDTQYTDIFMEKQTPDYVLIFTLPYGYVESKSLILQSLKEPELPPLKMILLERVDLNTIL